MYESILLVEDDKSFRETLAFSLRHKGYQVREVSHGEAALDEARLRVPDLILLDVMPPGLDGFSICRILRAEMETPISVGGAKKSNKTLLDRSSFKPCVALATALKENKAKMERMRAVVGFSLPFSAQT